MKRKNMKVKELFMHFSNRTWCEICTPTLKVFDSIGNIKDQTILNTEIILWQVDRNGVLNIAC